ncbi:hypothetical protein GXM_09053 [Nostoc sphaeroides CCNUC1]|uniref:Uncharacterized protein n=2 Tax=Nostoc sphaeroides TaxID=446679 RepID=A0A5P8WIB4_9NOSO|nr:hypothetical protein GXM_09053 [Nostoc sphaeroides CCNUC1]
MKNEGNLVETMPDGYEIYENPNSQVFLRRVQPKIISDEERATLELGIKEFSNLLDYQIDIKKEIITVYTADQDANLLSDMLHLSGRNDLTEAKTKLRLSISYSPMLRFILIDENRRIFMTQRYCFLGRIDDWIKIGNQGNLQELVENYVRHLGQESFFDLH